MNKCTYPIIVRRSYLYRVFGGRHTFTRSCGKPAVWRVMIWTRLPFAPRRPDWQALRCQGHRSHDVQERMLADRIREEML